MSAIAGLIATAIAGHLSGMALGGGLASKGWLGFASVLGEKAIELRKRRRAERAQKELDDWLEVNAREED